MKLDRTQENAYELRFPYDPTKVKLARIVGGRYETKGGDKRWVVESPEMCQLLHRCQKYAIAEGRDLSEYLVETITDKINESQEARDFDLGLTLPEGKRLMQPQVGGVKWLLHNPNVMEADPMGAGKTIMCAVAADKLKCKRVLIICPASVKVNWRREWRAWNKMAKRGDSTVAVVKGSTWPNTDVVIVNFDIIDRFRSTYEKDKDGKIIHDKSGMPVAKREGQVDAVDWDMVIIDECHKIKGRSAQRTRAIIGHTRYGKIQQTPITAKHRVAMSGTPMPNRPEEVWPIAFWLWPESFPNFHLFGMRYCGAKRGHFGWKYKGSSNEKELNARLRLLGMIARPKSLTHAEVPPKSRKIIEFPIKGMESIVEREKATYREEERDLATIRAKAESSLVFNDEEGFRSAMKDLRERVNLGVGKLTQARMEVAEAKVPYVVDYVKQELKQRDKIILFCWHRKIAELLYREFSDIAVKIDGGVQTEDRQPLIDRFQKDPECKIIIGTSCIWTGTTLTASDLILFVELHWVPGEVLQGEDRIHRKSQTKPCEIRYLVVEGSIDSVMSERIIDKLEVIEACTGPIQQALSNIPVSVADDEDMPVASTPFNELEDYVEKMDVTKVYTVRDRLYQIARGRCRKPHDIDQIVAGRLSNRKPWTPIQQALAELMVKKYYIEDYQERMFE
jgi:SNF2 family DNA or RNA helicase